MHNLWLLRLAQRRLFQSMRQQSNQVENYYDILRVRTDSNSKEIRDAFVRLTKKFHPDVKGAKPDAQQTAQFVKISEAYQTLSKPKLRSEYDQTLWSRGRAARNVTDDAQHTQTAEMHKPWEVKPNFDPNPGPYYGVQGLERVSNSKLALILMALGVFGAIFGFFSVKHSFSMNRQQLDDKSAIAGSHYANIRADALRYGNKEQLRRVVDRMNQETR